MPTSTVSLFAPGVNQMINSIETAMSQLDGDVTIKFKPTPLATTTAPDGAAATVWNVRAHEYASINGHTTTIVEDQKFLESHNYFSAKDADGALLECHFDHINAPAKCVKKQPKHHKTVTTTYKHARPFATAFHKHVQKHKKVENATTSALEEQSQSVAAAAVVQTQAPVVQVDSGNTADSTTTGTSAAGSNSRMNSTSGASKKAKSLPVLLVTASVLFTAVLAFQP